MTLHDVLFKPLTVGQSDYDWSAAVGVAFVGAGTAAAPFADAPWQKTLAFVAVFAGSLLAARGKPIVRVPDAPTGDPRNAFYHTEDKTP